MSELENKLLSRMTMSPREIERAINLGLKRGVFEDPLSLKAYDHLLAYYHDSQMSMAPTIWVLEEMVPGLKLPPHEDVDVSTGWLIEFLQRRYATNQYQEIIRSSGENHQENPLEALRLLHTAAYEATQVIQTGITHVDMALNIEDRRARYEAGAANEGLGGTGLTLGLDELDTWTGGLRSGELCAIGAFSKVGKTMFLVNCCAQARRQGATVAFYTLEMAKAEVETRMDCMFSGVSYNRASKFLLTKDEKEAMYAAQEEMAKLGSVHVLRPDEGDRTVAYVVNRARQLGADYLIIDQLSFMEASRKTQTLKEHSANVMKGLKTEISREAAGALPCLLAVQLNRKSLDQSDGPSLENFANASEIEQTADLLLGLSRNKEERAAHTMRMHMLGSRRCNIQDWLLQWELLSATKISVLKEI